MPDQLKDEAFAPELAKLAKEPPVGDTWLHEVKWDGCVSNGVFRQTSKARRLAAAPRRHFVLNRLKLLRHSNEL